MSWLSDYTDAVLASGQCTFSIDDLKAATNKGHKAIYSAIDRLRSEGKLASVAKGFYVIISPEYRILGCLPAEQFVPPLMKFWKLDYYVGLLSAARYHEASHQAPQVFQVVTTKQKNDIVIGRIKVQFIFKKNLSNTPIEKIATAKSMLQISSPEATAVDLLLYPNKCGGLNHIFTVLSELCASLNPKTLSALLEQDFPSACKQRLGYMLDILEEHEFSEVIEKHLSEYDRLDYSKLNPAYSEKPELHRNEKWKIIVNQQLESDL